MKLNGIKKRWYNENGNDFIADVMPSKIWVCHCEQCRYVKNKRKNRKLKKKVKRLLNKKRRKEVGTGVGFLTDLNKRLWKN